MIHSYTIVAYSSHLGEEEGMELGWCKEPEDEIQIVVHGHCSMGLATPDKQVGHTHGWRVVVVSTCVFIILETEARHLSLHIFSHFLALDVSGHDKIVALLLYICDCILLKKDSSFINSFFMLILLKKGNLGYTWCIYKLQTFLKN